MVIHTLNQHQINYLKHLLNRQGYKHKWVVFISCILINGNYTDKEQTELNEKVIPHYEQHKRNQKLQFVDIINY